MPDGPQGHKPSLALVPNAIGVQPRVVGFDARTLGRITAMAFDHPWRMGIAIFATVLVALSQLLIPKLIGTAVDQARGVLAGGGPDGASANLALAHTALLLLGASVFRGMCTMTQNYQGEAVGHLIAHDLRLAFYTTLQRLSFSYHDRVHTGELMTRGILDIEGTRMWVHTGILRMVLLVILIAGGTSLLMSIDPLLTGVALGFVPFVGVGASISRIRLRRLWYALQEELGVLTKVMEENLGGIRVVRAFASQAFEMTRFDVIADRALAISHRRIATFVVSTTAMTFAFFLSMGMVLWIGGERVIEDRLTLGELTAFLAFMMILQQPVRQIAWMVNSIARASTCGGRLFEILDLEPEIRDRADAFTLGDGEGVVRFENVSFTYHGRENEEAPAALENVSFEVRPGEVLAIVGPPGSGKSTIAHLIPRYYDVTGGRITIDGRDIRGATLESLRRQVSVVQQDAFLFTSTIGSNVAYGNPWANDEEIRDATGAAQIHEHIDGLVDGYETLVGERGVSLSGGQRQRLAIARAVVPGSRVIVFDDSTASVDAATEREIRRALAEATGHRATIVIAHRLSSLMHADEILFLDEGRIVERGSHETLVASRGRYAALYALQADTIEAPA